MRQIEENDLVNKTIKSIDNSRVNVLRLNFSDGSFADLIADGAVVVYDHVIPGIFIDDGK